VLLVYVQWISCCLFVSPKSTNTRTFWAYINRKTTKKHTQHYWWNHQSNTLQTPPCTLRKHVCKLGKVEDVFHCESSHTKLAITTRDKPLRQQRHIKPLLVGARCGIDEVTGICVSPPHQFAMSTSSILMEPCIHHANPHLRSFVLCTMQGVSSLMPSHIAIPQASNKIHKYLPRWTAFYWLSQWSMDDRSQSNGRQPNRRSLQVKTRHTYHYIVIRKNSTMLYVLLTYNIFWGLLWHPLFIWHGIFRRVCMAWNNRFGVQVYN
jgi:hypothetical protein